MKIPLSFIGIFLFIVTLCAQSRTISKDEYEKLIQFTGLKTNKIYSFNSQNKLTDREFAGLKGKVKSVASSYSWFEVKDGKPVEKQSGVKYEQHYDKNGNTILTLNYVVGEKNIYSFIDGDKTFKTEEITGIGGSGSGTTSVQESNPKPPDERFSIKFKYKYENQSMEEILYNNRGDLVSKTIYKYDEQGRIKETESYNTYKSDKLTGKTILKYDDNNILIGNFIVLFINNGSNSESTYSNYQFDTHGNWIERTKMTRYRRNGNLVKTVDRQKIDYYED